MELIETYWRYQTQFFRKTGRYPIDSFVPMKFRLDVEPYTADMYRIQWMHFFYGVPE